MNDRWIHLVLAVIVAIVAIGISYSIISGLGENSPVQTQLEQMKAQVDRLKMDLEKVKEKQIEQQQIHIEAWSHVKTVLEQIQLNHLKKKSK